MESYIYRERKPIVFITVVSLLLIGLILYLGGLIFEPAEELRFLRAEIGHIHTIPKHFLAFGFFSIVAALYGVYGVSTNAKFHFRFACAILFIMTYELGVIATYLITQKMQAWYINAEILEIAGAVSFVQYLRQSNFSSVKPSLIEAESNIENVRKFHYYFECCSGFMYNSWKPLFPNYICCKKGVDVPCTSKNSYEDRCDQKLLKYAWQRYRYYVIICGAAFTLQTTILGIITYLYNLEQKRIDAKKRK